MGDFEIAILTLGICCHYHHGLKPLETGQSRQNPRTLGEPSLKNLLLRQITRIHVWIENLLTRLIIRRFLRIVKPENGSQRIFTGLRFFPCLGPTPEKPVGQVGVNWQRTFLRAVF